MKIGIIGLAQAGKKTLFHLLTGVTPSAQQGDQQQALIGIAAIRDPRFDALVKMYQPQKVAPAKIEVASLPRLDKEVIAQGRVFKDIAHMDALCFVVRDFQDEAVYHPDGSVDPVRDFNFVNSEIILHDLVFVETRLERLEKALQKKKTDRDELEKILMNRMKQHLEAQKPLRNLVFSPEEKQLICGYELVTLKKMVVVFNVSEDAVGVAAEPTSHQEIRQNHDVEVMQVSAKVEAEISSLGTETEKQEFLAGLGIKEPALSVLTRLCLKALNQISFFTVGKDEVRQWQVGRGAVAPQAAGVIHSDLERGFIRAELMKYNDLITLGNESAVKSAGKFHSKGKDYVVEDGDIINVLFNV